LGQANGVVNQGMGPSNAFLLGTGFAGIKKVGQLSVQEINRQAAINKVLNSSSIHGAPVKVPKVLRFVGRFGGFAFSAWGAYDIREQYRHGEITPFQNGVEQASNTIGAIPAVGTAWSIGWEIGRGITNIPAYQKWKNKTWLPWRQDVMGY
jgi:hypothetical protein